MNAAASTPAKKTAAKKTAKKSTTKTAATKSSAASSASLVKVDLPEEIFDARTNVALIHQVVVAQQAAARQGTHSTKRRGEVRGGGRKPYKQKGTGRARQGSTRAPQFTGGGVVHGPQPRSYDQRTPKKMKAAALRGALSDRARNDRVHVVESLISGDTPSTRSALGALLGLADRRRFLLVLERTDSVTWLSLRNAPEVHIVAVDQLNTYDVIASDDVVFTKGAYDAFVSGKAEGRAATIVEPAGNDAVDADEAGDTGSDGSADEDQKPAKKTAAKKTAAKKAPAKKAAAKKAPAKKAATTKAAASKNEEGDE